MYLFCMVAKTFPLGILSLMYVCVVGYKLPAKCKHDLKTHNDIFKSVL